MLETEGRTQWTIETRRKLMYRLDIVPAWRQTFHISPPTHSHQMYPGKTKKNNGLYAKYLWSWWGGWLLGRKKLKMKADKNKMKGHRMYPGCSPAASTIYLRSSDPLYIVSYYIKWATTSWTNSILVTVQNCRLIFQNHTHI